MTDDEVRILRLWAKRYLTRIGYERHIEDITQEMLCRLLESKGNRFYQHLAIDAIRHLFGVRGYSRADHGTKHVAFNPQKHGRAQDSQVENRIECQQWIERMKSMTDPQDLQIFLNIYLDGMGLPEIGRECGLTKAAVWHRLKRVRNAQKTPRVVPKRKRVVTYDNET